MDFVVVSWPFDAKFDWYAMSGGQNDKISDESAGTMAEKNHRVSVGGFAVIGGMTIYG